VQTSTAEWEISATRHITLFLNAFYRIFCHSQIDELYRAKLIGANNQANKQREAAARAREEAMSFGAQLRELEKSTKDHQGIVDSLNRRVKVQKGNIYFKRLTSSL
jgi:hypothetical protein